MNGNETIDQLCTSLRNRKLTIKVLNLLWKLNSKMSLKNIISDNLHVHKLLLSERDEALLQYHIVNGWLSQNNFYYCMMK